MKLLKNISSTFVLVASFFGGASVHAGLVSSVVRGGLGIFIPSVDPSVAGSTAGKNVIGGAGVDIGVGPASVLVDVFYAQRSFSSPTVVPAPSTNTVTFTQIFVPVQAQVSMGMIHFSGGGYYSKGLGKVSVKSSLQASPVESEYSVLGYDSVDYGAVAGVGVGFPLGIASVSLDVRFNYGLKDVDTSADSFKNQSIDLLVGVRF